MTDFYQSPADKLRFEILLKSLREGSLNLAIVGDDEVALSSYGRQIYDHLKDAGEEHVEWWSSADSEKLVQRFNDILSELTVDEALDKSQKRSPKRYMIFPDTHAIQDFELQLLARLINGFPTSNINLVLVVNQEDPYEEKLAVFGKNLLQWILESENPPSAKTPKRSNKIETLDESPKLSSELTTDAIADFSATFAATLASGKFPGPGESKTSAIGNVSPSDKPEFDPLMDSPGKGIQSLGQDAEPQTNSSLSTKVAGILIIAIVLTVSAFGLIYKDEVAKEAQDLQDFVSGKKPATAKTSTPAKAAQPTAPAPAAAETSAVDPNVASAPSAPSAQTAPAAVGPNGSNVVSAPSAPSAPPTVTAPSTVAATPSTPATPPAPSTPPSAVGMSSSVKIPVKAGDSLIPNKEVMIAPKAPATAASAPVTATVAAPPTAPVSTANTPTSSPPTPPASPAPSSSSAATSGVAPVKPTTPVTPAVAAPQAAVTTAQSVPPTPTTSNTKQDSKSLAQQNKGDTKTDAREAKTAAREQPKESVKETPRETKPVSKTAQLKANEPLPKLDPKADKLDKADKAEESKPRSGAAESSAAFRPRPEDQRWVQGLPEDGWVMQHAALDSLEEAKAFQQSSPFYRDAKVMYTKRKEAPPYYIVVTGPYTSRQEAESETRKHPIMAKSWVRSARSLKNQFED